MVTPPDLTSVLSESDWLNSLNPGDLVIVSAYGQRFSRVERVTRTLVIVDGQQFSRERGRLRTSDRWSNTYLLQPTPERVRVLSVANARSFIKSVNLGGLPDELVLSVAEQLRAADKERNAVADKAVR